MIFEKQQLQTALKTLTLARKENKIRQILNHFLCECNGNTARLTCTNLEQTIVCTIAEFSGATETFIINYDIIQYLEAVQAEKVTITISKVLELDEAEFLLFDHTEYPTIKTEIPEKKTDITKHLSKIFNSTSFASRDEQNLAINGVRLDDDIIAATDSFKMIKYDCETGIQTTIPLNAVNILKKINPESVTITTNKMTLVFEMPNITLSTRTLQLAYPNIKNIIEAQNSTHTIQIIRKELIEKLTKSIVFSDLIMLDFEHKNMRATGDTKKIKQPFEFLVVKGDFEQLKKISLNAKYLLEAATKSNEKELTMQLSSDRTPIIIDNFILLAPTAIREE
jgi:DNA polymerase-3 subunit beta